MTRVAAFTFVILATSVHSLAHAIEREGNGGGYIVCRSPDRSILKFEAYDLWRAHHEGVVIGGKRKFIDVRRHNELSARDQAYVAAEKIKQYNSIFYRNTFKPMLDGMIAKIDAERQAKRDVRPPMKLDFEPEAFPTEKYCPDEKIQPSYETVVYYVDSGRLSQNETYLEKYFQIRSDFQSQETKPTKQNPQHGQHERFEKYFVERMNTELFNSRPLIQSLCDGMTKDRNWGSNFCLSPWLWESRMTLESFLQLNHPQDISPRDRLSAWHPAEFEFDRLTVALDVLNDREHGTETDLAANYLHETAYKYLRLVQPNTKADQVNTIVAALLSDLPIREINSLLKGQFEFASVDSVIEQLNLELLAARSIEDVRKLSKRREWVEGQEIGPELGKVIRFDPKLRGSAIGLNFHENYQLPLLAVASLNLRLAVVEFLVREIGVDLSQKIEWKPAASQLKWLVKSPLTPFEIAKKAITNGKDQRQLKDRILALLK